MENFPALPRSRRREQLERLPEPASTSPSGPRSRLPRLRPPPRPALLSPPHRRCASCKPSCGQKPKLSGRQMSRAFITRQHVTWQLAIAHVTVRPVAARPSARRVRRWRFLALINSIKLLGTRICSSARVRFGGTLFLPCRSAPRQRVPGRRRAGGRAAQERLRVVRAACQHMGSSRKTLGARRPLTTAKSQLRIAGGAGEDETVQLRSP